MYTTVGKPTLGCLPKLPRLRRPPSPARRRRRPPPRAHFIFGSSVQEHRLGGTSDARRVVFSQRFGSGLVFITRVVLASPVTAGNKLLLLLQVVVHCERHAVAGLTFRKSLVREVENLAN